MNPQNQPLEPSLPQNHEDQIACKRYISMTQYNLVPKFIPVPQAMTITDAKAAVDKERMKLETIPAWQLDKVKCIKEVIPQAQRDHKKVHFDTLMDICHLKKCGVRAEISEVRRSSRAPRIHRKRRLWSLRSIYLLNKAHLLPR